MADPYCSNLTNGQIPQNDAGKENLNNCIPDTSKVTDQPPLNPDSAYVSVGGNVLGYGHVGVAITGQPDVVPFAGVSTPGKYSAEVGVVPNGKNASEYLTGWSCGGNLGLGGLKAGPGAGSTPDGVAKGSFGTPGASCTYGVSARDVAKGVAGWLNRGEVNPDTKKALDAAVTDEKAKTGPDSSADLGQSPMLPKKSQGR